MIKAIQTVIDGVFKIFETEGYEVVLAENGTEAIGLISQSAFSMVILDVEMPNVNGFEVLKAIRKFYPPVKRPVIMISAYDSQEHILKAAKLLDGLLKEIAKDANVVDQKIIVIAALQMATDLIKQKSLDNFGVMIFLHIKVYLVKDTKL